MRTVSVTRTLDAPREAVWAVLSDFPNMASWSSSLKGSKATSKATAGVGASRHCDFATKGYVKETVATWEEGKGYIVNFTDTDAPMKNASAGFKLADSKNGRTQATFIMNYEMKMGPLGKLMDVMMVRKQMGKNGNKILNDLEAAGRKLSADPARK